MNRIFKTISSIADWQALHPKKHWRTGYSACTLAHCWGTADGFPPEVSTVLKNTDNPLLADLTPLLAIPEFKVPLPGGRRASQNDIFVLAQSRSGPVSIMVEGKVNEPFDKCLGKWCKKASPGKKERLNYLLDTLSLNAAPPDALRYQLLHRSASAIIEGVNRRAVAALLVVHSFSERRTGWSDYEMFLSLFDVQAVASETQLLSDSSKVPLFSAWVRGNLSFLER